MAVEENSGCRWRRRDLNASFSRFEMDCKSTTMVARREVVVTGEDDSGFMRDNGARE